MDDGSTDACPQICEEYAAAYGNVCVIHQANAGLSAARNAGIKEAKGKYVCFVDSDDYWEQNVLRGLMAQVERDNLDVLRFRFQNVNEKYNVFNPYESDPAKDNDYSAVPTDGVSFLNSRMNTQCYAVMFILRRELLNECIFTPGIYFEDTDWTPRMLCKAKRVASTNSIVYNYLMREGSITNANSRSKKEKVLNDKIRLIAALQQQVTDLRKSGCYNRWYLGMISEIVVSVIGMLSVDFYEEKSVYLNLLRELNVFPIKVNSAKAWIINVSPEFSINLLHKKNV